ncbi:MAG TPA: glycosyltransferase family 2 protein [Sphingomonadales bacterium]
MPRVSVVIPVFNAARTIERALASVFRQTFTDYEVILVDDGSSDGSVARIEEVLDAAGEARRARCRVIRLPQNQGAAAARNAGIKAAQGEFVAFLDADDEWLEDKLARQIAAFDAAGDAVVGGCNAEWRGVSGKFSHHLEDGPVVTGRDAWKALLKSCYLSTPCVIARRDALEAAGGFDPALPVGEDQDLWFRLAESGPVLYLTDVLVRIHKQPDSLMSRQRMGMVEHYVPMVERHVARNSDRLTARERREILGPLYAQVGRYMYVTGNPGIGARMLLRAVRMGERPFFHLLFMLAKLPYVIRPMGIKRSEARHV